MSKLGALHIINHTGPKHVATVIFFHGSGSSGRDMMTWVSLLYKKFQFPYIKVLFPTAPLQRYSAADGQMSNVWFDRVAISPDFPEVYDSLSAIEEEVKNLIKKENLIGIPSSNIIVGGFSMGGALALHTALRWDRNLAGVFAFSSFLNNDSIVYKDVKESPDGTRLPPLLQLHGNNDDLVEKKWGQDTFKELTKIGVQGEFHELEKLGHSLNKRGLVIIKEWIEKLFPPPPENI